MQKMNRFAKYWDLYANSGQFKNFTAFIRAESSKREDKSFFWQFFAFSEFLATRHTQSFGISLLSLMESAFAYLAEHMNVDLEEAREILAKDYALTPRRDTPKFLQGTEYATRAAKMAASKEGRMNKRQQRHLAD
jgi:hypothetical protein